MTGRRAVKPWPVKVSRAFQFVPGHVGGRVASAQPIRRRGGNLRQASIGATGVPVPMLPVYIDHDLITSSTTPGADTLDTSGLAALSDDGNLFIVWCAGAGVGAFTAPAGWTVEASGSVGTDVTYLVAWTNKSASTDWDFMFADPIDADAWRGAMATVWQFEGLTAAAPVTTLTVDVSTATASTTEALPSAPTGTWMPSWGASPDFYPSGTSSQWNAYQASATDGSTSGSSNYVSIPGSGSMTAEDHAGVLIGRVNGYLGGCISGSPVVSASSDWVLLSFGFTTVGYGP